MKCIFIMKHKTLLLLLILIFTLPGFAQVKINDNTGDQNINNSSLLELESTGKAFVPPRMTTAQKNAVSSPLEGAIIYDTDLKMMCIYTDGAWSNISSGNGNADPAGVIQAIMGTTPPDGWLLCDGSTFNGTTYPELQTVLGGTTLPDLRDKFLRGNPSSGRTLGSLQAYATARPLTAFATNSGGNHYHSIGGYDQETVDVLQQYHNYTAANPSPQMVGKNHIEDPFGGGNTAEGQELEMATSTDGAHTHTITGGGDSETRPVNVSVNYIIRAK